MPGPQAQYRVIRTRLVSAFLCCLLVLLVLIVFGPSLTHDFVWDDHGLIVQNPDIHVEGHWARPFLRSFWQTGANTEDPTRSFYRPLVSISYRLDYLVWGLNPMGYHLTNLLLHATVTCLVYLLGLRLLEGRTPAFVAAALFAVHPSHVENVVWISGRTDLLSALFVLAALLAFPHGDNRSRLGWRPVAAVSLFYLLALLGKEMALSAPLIILAFVAIQPGGHARWHRYLPVIAGVFLVTGGYLLLRIMVLGRVVGPGLFGAPGERLAAIPGVVMRYAGLMAHLVAIDPHHPETYAALTHPWVIITGTLMMLGYIALLVVLWRRVSKTSALLLGWFLIALLPVLKLGVFGDVLYADRFLYLPSIGLLVGVVALWSKARLTRDLPWISRALGPLLVLLYVTGSIMLVVIHTRYWKNNRTLFERVAHTSPDSAYVQYNVANSRNLDGEYASAIQAYLRAVHLEPGYRQAFANMGIALTREGRYVDATFCFKKALSLGDRSVITYTNLGNAYRALGDKDQARNAYRKSLAIAETVAARNNLGECSLPDSPRDAYRHFLRAYGMEASPRILSNLALALIELGEDEQALPYLYRAFASLPGPPDRLAFAVNYNLARALHNTGKLTDAKHYAKQADVLWRGGHGPVSASDDKPALLSTILNSKN